MWLPWPIAIVAAVVCAVSAAIVPPSGRATREARAILRELAVVLVLYTAWRLAGEISIMGVGGAFTRGLDLWHLERWMNLPNELTLQQWTLHAPWLVRFANAYYIVVHVFPVGIFLVWLFFRHRDRYPRWRNLLAFVSIVCVLVQLVPVAPPRMYPGLGFVDTAAVYGPAFYDSVGRGLAGQLAAMPSLHVAWAVLIGLAVVLASTSRWRWLVLAHPALTLFAVTVTAYHWLLDGIVAAAILLVGLALFSWIGGRADRRRRADRATEANAVGELVGVRGRSAPRG